MVYWYVARVKNKDKEFLEKDREMGYSSIVRNIDRRKRVGKIKKKVIKGIQLEGTNGKKKK